MILEFLRIPRFEIGTYKIAAKNLNCQIAVANFSGKLQTLPKFYYELKNWQLKILEVGVFHFCSFLYSGV